MVASCKPGIGAFGETKSDIHQDVTVQVLGELWAARSSSKSGANHGRFRGSLCFQSMNFEDINPSYKIVPANWRDLGALRKLERECFPLDAWPLLDLIAVLSFPNVVRLKATVLGEIVGFIAGEQRLGENLAWIATIGVLPAFQRHGIGSALLDACEQGLGAPRIRLCVRIGNTPAIQLYKILGYQQVGKWAAYYQDGSDAIVFEKSFRSTL